jgi:multiple sugar transport system substrate-binding protein
MRSPAIVLLVIAACSKSEPADSGRTEIVFKHGKLFSSSKMILELIAEFERENPTITVLDEELPSNTDEQHRFFAINLEGESADFDVFPLDVIWVSEFTRAGWVRPLDHLLTEEQRADLFSGTLDAVTYGGHVNAIPWHVTAGLLYYRTDLVPAPPKSWQELAEVAKRAMDEHPGMHGFVWQGKQYEGLVCDALEYMWSFGGSVVEDSRSAVDSKANRDALRFMRSLIERGISPEFVLTMTEEPSRRTFQDGRAVFLRAKFTTRCW